MRILIAPNAFKNSLSATGAAEAVLAGLKKSRLRFEAECFPVGDGGNGTAELIIKRNSGRLVTVRVHDPIGREIRASFGLIDDGKTAVIEMADASGLQFFGAGELNPLRASTAGTGEMIRFALDAGVGKIILCMGGSATVDGGAGILHALGVRFLNAGGQVLAPVPEAMLALAAVDLSAMDNRMADCKLLILCDVDNRLLGGNGAAAVFGPQKGAGPEDVKKLEAVLQKIQQATLSVTGRNIALLKHGGTAGGAAAGLHGLLNATLVNGIDQFLEMTGFEQALAQADLVITGEGSIDEQTLHGKGPYGVASRAKEKGLPVVALAGRVPLKANAQLDQYFDVLLAIGQAPADLATAMRTTAENLSRVSTAVGNLLAIS